MDSKYKFLLTGLLFSFLFFPFFQTSHAFFDWFDWFGWFKNGESQSAPTDNLSVKQHTLLISKIGSGSLTSDDGKINCGNEDICEKIYTYAAGSKVTLTALPNSGYVLDKWNDCDSSSGNKCEITVNKSQTMTVKFIQKAKGFSNVSQKKFSAGKSFSSSPKDKLCAQVITSAKNKITGECKEFSNSCIPSGWEKVGGCNLPKSNSSKSSSSSKRGNFSLKLSSSSSFGGKTSSSLSILLEEIGNESDWKLIGPSDGRVNTVEILSNNELLIGTKSGGVFRSINGRSSWKSFSDGLVSKKIYFLKKIKGRIFAATGDGLYLLNEINSSWKRVYQEGTPFKEFFTIKEDADGNIWSLGEDGLYFSKDGFSWEKNKFISIEKAPTTVVKTPDLLLTSKKGDIYVITKNGLHQSKDKGITWKNIFAKAVSITEDETGAIYVINSDNLYKKDYNQNNFEKMDYNDTPKSGVVYYNEGILYTEEVSALLFSRDYGKTFERISEGWSWEKGFWDIRQILSIGDHNVILVNDNGVSEIDINSKSIKKYPKVKNYSEVTSFSLTQSGEKFTMAVAYWDHASVFSFDGNNWGLWEGGEFDNHYLDPQSNFIVACTNNNLRARMMKENGTRELINDYSCAGNNNNAVVFDDSMNPSKAYVIAIKKNNGKRVLLSFKATSDSAKFNAEEYDISNIYASSIAIDPSNKSRFVVLGDNKLQETLDGGKTWNLFADLDGRTGFKISVNPFDSKEVMLSGLFGNVIKVSNGKVSDLKLPYDTSKTNDNFVYDVAYDDKKQNVVYAASQQGLFYSTNNGESWVKFTNGLYSKDVRVVIPKDDKVFIGVWGSGTAYIKKDILLRSKDND